MLVKEVQLGCEALGATHYYPAEAEKKSLVFRRSLYFVKDMATGEIITTKCIRSIRSRYGLPPKYSYILLGKKVNKSIEQGTSVS
jgi:sialic acid synthase SpsE